MQSRDDVDIGHMPRRLGEGGGVDLDERRYSEEQVIYY